MLDGHWFAMEIKEPFVTQLILIIRFVGKRKTCESNSVISIMVFQFNYWTELDADELKDGSKVGQFYKWGNVKFTKCVIK